MEFPHLHIMGSTGTGKSTHTLTYLRDRITDGHGLVYFDPHGPDTDTLLDHIPQRRRRDVTIFDPTQYQTSWNPFADVATPDFPMLASSFVTAIRAIAKMDSIGTARMDMYVRMSVLACLHLGGKLTDIPYLLRDTDFLKEAIPKLPTGPIRDFWEHFATYSGKERRDETASTYNKFQPFLADERVRRCLDAAGLSIREVVDGRQILLVRLPQGRLGTDMTAMLGSLIAAQVHTYALTRSQPVPLHLVFDECHTWASATIRELITGARKFGVTVVASHQFASQVERGLFDALIGNCVGHIFRVSEKDARLFHRRFSVQDTALNLEELPNFTYRRFPWQKSDPDVPVSPLGEPLRRSRSDIDKAMRSRG